MLEDNIWHMKMSNAVITLQLSLISGHLTGIAQGLSWHKTDKNRTALQSCAEMLERDSIALMLIVEALRVNKDCSGPEKNA